MSPTYRLGTVGLEACGERGEETGASGPVGKLIGRIQAPGAGIAGREGKAGAPAPHLSCVWSASEPSQKSAFPKQPSSCHECQPFASFCFRSVALCKTGSATVTMALFVAEKCAFENSENHWPLVQSEAVLMESPRGWAPPHSHGLPLPDQHGWTGSRSVPETADQAAQPSGIPSCVGPQHRGGRGWPSARQAL